MTFSVEKLSEDYFAGLKCHLLSNFGVLAGYNFFVYLLGMNIKCRPDFGKKQDQNIIPLGRGMSLDIRNY